MQNVQAKLQQALKFHGQGQLAEAKILYQEILQVHPTHPDALFLLGGLAYQTQNYPLAIDLLKKAIEVAPNNHHCHNTLGHVLRAMNEYQEALEAYGK